MIIGLISDTHIPEAADALPATTKEALGHVDLILHAGDIYIVSVLDELEVLAPVLAAEGDDDYEEVYRDPRVRQEHILQVGGLTLWLRHIRPWTWPRKEKVPDILVFGHTHKATIDKSDGILLINPGSPTFPSYKYEPGTIAILAIDCGKVDARIVKL
jgi:putative phosphoesterase